MKSPNHAMLLIRLARKLKEMTLSNEDIQLAKALNQEAESGAFYTCFPFVLRVLPELFDQ
jgi:hypothetical protein